MNYQFNWSSAFETAFNGSRRLLDEHIDKAKDQVLMPMLRAKARNNNDAEEVASLVITKFWERFFVKEEVLPDNVNGYLYTMANNAFFHHSKMKDKHTKQFLNLDIGEMNQVFEGKVGEQPTFSSQNVHDEKEKLFQALEDSFKNLGDKCKQLLKMFIFEKKKMKDIHKVLDIPTANAATKKKESCINKLRKLMYKEIHNHKIQGYV